MADAPEGTIGEASKNCADLFLEVIDVAWSDVDEIRIINKDLRDEFGRFKLWYSNIGVFAGVQESLDFRLREIPDVKNLFLRQLETIVYRLHQLKVYKDKAERKPREKNESDLKALGDNETINRSANPFEDWSTGELLQAIHESIDWLHRLSNMVRKASFLSQNRKAKNFRVKDSKGQESDESTKNLTNVLRTLYNHYIKRDCSGLQNPLAQRLVDTMLIRHMRILYRRARQQRWAIQRVVMEPFTKQALFDGNQARKLPEPRGAVRRGERSDSPAEPSVKRERGQQRPSLSTLDVEAYRHNTTPSALSRTGSMSMTKQGEELIPPPPKIRDGVKDFICDFCCLILPSSDALKLKAWKEHVMKDLDPYICVFDDCDNALELYASSQQWLSHRRARHRMRWHCFATDHEPSFFESPEELAMHLKSVHHNDFYDDQLSAIVESSAEPLNPTLEHCPFCDQNPRDIDYHVGQHLRDFALLSLPWPDGVEDDSQKSMQQRTESNSSKSGIRDTARDLCESPTPLDFDDGPLDTSAISESERVPEPESVPETEAGTRFDLYGYIPEIYTQQGSVDAIAQLKDTALAKFASRQYSHGIPVYSEDDKDAFVKASRVQRSWKLLYHMTKIYVRVLRMRRPEPSLPDTESFGRVDTEEDESQTLESKLWDAQIEWPKGENRYFIPADDLERLLTADSIIGELKRCLVLSLEELQQRAEQILVGAPKLFAILVYLSKSECILSFLDENLSDEDLPFVRAEVDANGLVTKSFKLRSRRNPHGYIKCMGNWGRNDITAFDRDQWWMLAPIFVQGDHSTVRHWELEDNCVLPFIKDQEYKAKEGGFASVWGVLIHPAHQYLYESQNLNFSNPWLAVKRLYSTRKEDFDREVAILTHFNNYRHPNLINLLATFRLKGRFHFIFPFASGNLREYWERNPLPQASETTLKWSLSQCMGIASGLMAIHDNAASSTDGSISSMHGDIEVENVKERLYGRHGDIKPENILWTATDPVEEGDPHGVLQIGDFGLAEFHTLTSRSNIDPRTVKGSPTYEPPERRLGISISRAYDIWSLGCVYLEFITWLVYGYKGLITFPDYRGTSGYTCKTAVDSINDDTYYTILSNPRGAIVRESVTEWIEELYEKPQCSRFIHDFLDLVKNEMLVVDASKRIICAHLNKRLKHMLEQATVGSTYLTATVPRPALEEKETTVSREHSPETPTEVSNLPMSTITSEDSGDTIALNRP